MGTMSIVAEQVSRLHHRVNRIPVLGPAYLRALGRAKALRGSLEFLSWKWLGVRPLLDRAFVQELYAKVRPAAEPAAAGSSKRIEGRLVVRISFHLVKARMSYLVEMLEQIRELPFSEVFIAIDTNSRDTQPLLEAAGVDFVNEFAVHEDLDDPFKLTWRHRDRMRAVLDQFDYFMYAEDDLLITPDSVRLWHDRLEALKPMGYLPGFLRVELNRNGTLVASDFATGADADLVRTIDGKRYLASPFPYQAFWLYDKATMLEFVESDLYENGEAGSPVRECMALGYTYEATPDGRRSRHLLPMNDQGQVDPHCYVFHMPSNYGQLRVPHPAGLGTIPADDLINAASARRDPNVQNHAPKEQLS